MNKNIKRSKALKKQLFKKFDCPAIPNLASSLYAHCMYQPKLIEELLDSSFKRDALMQCIAKRLSRDGGTYIRNASIHFYVRDYLQDKKLIGKEYWQNFHKEMFERKKYYDALISKMDKKDIYKILLSTKQEDYELQNELIARGYTLYTNND